MVAFDATIISLFIHPGAKPPNDSQGQPVTQCQERIEYLVQVLQDKREKIIIPTPSLAEVLVVAGAAGPTYLTQLSNSARFKICPFDEKASVEAAIAIRKALDSLTKGAKKSGTGTWAKVKFDRQIVAISKVEGAHTIYSDDEDIKKYAASFFHASEKSAHFSTVEMNPAIRRLLDLLSSM
jgi:hypothetical protein